MIEMRRLNSFVGVNKIEKWLKKFILFYKIKVRVKKCV